MVGPKSEGVEDRWKGYLEATVVVEIDQALVDLTGARAVEPWPFSGAVLALTAWDPSGATRSRAENEINNGLLRSDLLSAGARVWNSVGYDQRSKGDHQTNRTEDADLGVFLDEGFVVTGLTDEHVLGLARRYGQEAIYRIDNDDLTVMATESADRDTRPRSGYRPGS